MMIRNRELVSELKSFLYFFFQRVLIIELSDIFNYSVWESFYRYEYENELAYFLFIIPVYHHYRIAYIIHFVASNHQRFMQLFFTLMSIRYFYVMYTRFFLISKRLMYF